MADGKKPSDQGFEILLGRLLRTGVVIAAVIVLAGGVAFLSHSQAPSADYGTFHGAPAGLNEVRSIVHGAAGLAPLAVIQFGLLVLIATPVARVLFSMLGFVLERDWMYVGVTAIVLGLLIYSLANHSAR
ncbi:MAG TPA: DUF1634 domain-containing protein [Candidatus Acidoferrales bacterium]